MKKYIAVVLAVLCGIAAQAQTKSFPKIDQKGRIAIVAHRGFWKCDAAGYSENSLASLKAAQKAGLWGSECDIHLTKDDVIIVNHNNDVDGHRIADHTYAQLQKFLLPNGECRPTFEQYLAQAKKSRKTRLVIELKIQPNLSREDLLVDKTIAALKKYGMYDPRRVLFISFSLHMTELIARKCPEFVNQFLTSEKNVDHNPQIYCDKAINGVDFHYNLFTAHPEWVETAHRCGMSVNAWTVNKTDDIKRMIDCKVDAITTNEPLLVRSLLGKKNEWRK